MYIYLYMYIIYLWGGGGHEMKYIPQCSMAFCHTNNRILRDDHQLDIDVCFGGGEIIEMPQSSMAQLELATFWPFTPTKQIQEDEILKDMDEKSVLKLKIDRWRVVFRIPFPESK